MEAIVLVLILALAALLAGIVCGIVAFIRIGGILRRIAWLEAELRWQKTELKTLTRRLDQMSAEQPPPRPKSPPEEEPEKVTFPQTPPPVPKRVDAPRPVEERQPATVTGSTPRLSTEPTTAASPFNARLEEKVRDLTENLSWEMLAGTKGLLWAGVITLVVGVALFLKHLYDLGIIDERIRLAIAVAGGGIALALGKRFRKRSWPVISQGFTGLGIAVFYVCVYFSFEIYGLTGQTASFILACCVTALAITLAVLQDAPSIAVLGVIGGFLSPVFISTGENRPHILFGYIILLDLVAAGAAWFKRWRFLDALCLAGTALLYSVWYVRFFRHPDEPDMTVPATVYASAFYLLFLGSSSLPSLVRQVKSRPEDLIVAALNAAFWFFCYYRVLYPPHRHLLGGIVLGQAALVFLVFLAMRKRVPGDSAARAVLLAVAMGLSVLAMPILLRLYTYQIAWAVQGVIFVYLGNRYRHDLAVGGGIVAWTLGASALLLTLPLHTERFIPVFNTAFGSWACVIAAGVVIALILNRWTEEGRPWKVPAIGFVGVAGLALACLLLTAETALFWSTRGYENYRAYQHSSLAVLWAAVPFAVIAFLWHKRLHAWLMVALVTYGVALVFWFLSLAHYRLVEPWMFLNVSFVTRLMLVGSVAAAASLVFRSRTEDVESTAFQLSARQLTSALVLASYLLGVVLLNLEVWTFWEVRSVAHTYNHLSGSLVVLWSVIGLATATVIFLKRLRSWPPLLIGAYAVSVLVFVLSLHRYQVPETYLILNTTFLARLALPLSLWLGAHLLRKLGQIHWSDLATTTGHVLFAMLAAFELWYWAERTELVSEKMAMSFISSAWGLQAFALIVIGMVLRSRTQRLLGIVFFAITIAKVWLVDLSAVEPLYRILSFIAVGLLLLPAAVLYQRFSDIIAGEHEGEQEPAADAPGETPTEE